jgi:VanZ family protein
MISTFAFCLPGSALPKNDWLAKIYADKWIHIGIFVIMIMLWCLPLLHKQTRESLVKLFLGISIGFFGYGILIEIVQHFFIANRSFDWADIVADGVGCVIGLFFVRSQWKYFK